MQYQLKGMTTGNSPLRVALDEKQAKHSRKANSTMKMAFGKKGSVALPHGLELDKSASGCHFVQTSNSKARMRKSGGMLPKIQEGLPSIKPAAGSRGQGSVNKVAPTAKDSSMSIGMKRALNLQSTI